MSAGSGLVDYFVISGLNVPSGLEPDQLSGDNLECPPLDRPFKSRLLAHYPENVPWNPFDQDACCMLCHPKGLRFRTKSENRDPYFHTFLITKEDGSRTFGAALTFFEEVESKEICSAMHTLQAMHLAELSNAQSRTLYSGDRNHRRKHRRPPAVNVGRVYEIKRDKLCVTKCISIISQQPLVSTFEKTLRSFYSMIQAKEVSGLPLESYVYNLIHEVPLPPQGRSLQLTAPTQNVTCQRPGLSELPLVDYSLSEAIELLGVDTFLQLFTCVMLEHQILIYSQDYGRLMLVAESLTSLLFPFAWQHVYVPILPASLQHFLDAPVPFIMGLHHTTDSQSLTDIYAKGNMCVVNVDCGKIELPEDLPQLPFHRELLEDLLKIFTHLSHNGSRNSNGSAISHVSNASTGSGGLTRPTSDFINVGGAPGDHQAFLTRLSACSIDTDSGLSSVGSSSSSSSMWSIHQRMDMLQHNETLAKITALAKRTGVISSLEDISDSLVPDQSQNFHAPLSLDARRLINNNSIREVFLHYIMLMFSSYEEFIIMPNQHDLESWISNRESMQNFDKASFLSDHSEGNLPFLSAFIESQMFVCMIDNKIIAQWEDPDPHLRIFETRLRVFKERLRDRQSTTFQKPATAIEAERIIEKRATVIDMMAPGPHPLEDLNPQPHRQGFFPILDSNILGSYTQTNKVKREGARWRKKDRVYQQSEHLQMSSDQREKYFHEARAKGLRQPNLANLKPAEMAQTNWKFVEALLKECKAKTKRMLVEKMGQEAVELGHGDASLTCVEENTLIASLCDLLERIWSHGLQNKKGKSALWSHLLAYQEMEECNSRNKTVDPNLLTPDISSLGLESDSCPSGTQTWPVRRHRRKPSRGPELPLLSRQPTSVLQDMQSVQLMGDIKTEVGRARAWVRLSLEKKLLSRHLKELLSNSDLLRSMYKRYAFLRCEDEREQFLYHLLSLNAVDYYCFTNAFVSTAVGYRVLIFPRMKTGGGGTTTANCWFYLAGQLGETGRIPIPKHTLDVHVQHKNLGVLTTLRIGHDNAGMSPRWLVEHILVRNEITSHTYRFPCGRWLGKGVDDGSTERLLVAEIVPPTTDHTELMEKCRTPPRCRSPSMPRRATEPRLAVSDIQEMLGDAVNNLVKHFYKPEKERGSLTGLLCGEYGLVYCMEHVFQCGFKSARFFRNRFFVWDFIEKVQSCFDCMLTGEMRIPAGLTEALMATFCNVVVNINDSSQSVGKDGKFQIFICLGVRDGNLQQWIKAMSLTPVAASMYEDNSFLRDPALVTFLTHILDSLKDFKITLEASLTKGLHL